MTHAPCAIEPIGSRVSNLHYHAWVQKNRARVRRTERGQTRLRAPARTWAADGHPRVPAPVLSATRPAGPGHRRPLQRRRQRVSEMVHQPAVARADDVHIRPHDRLRRRTRTRTVPRPPRSACSTKRRRATATSSRRCSGAPSGLGKLVGKRSWGGIIGITNRGMLMDGGSVNVPGVWQHRARSGQWTIEGYGVDPDIEVDNDLASLLQGRDPTTRKGRGGPAAADGTGAAASNPSRRRHRSRPADNSLLKNSSALQERACRASRHAEASPNPPIRLRFRAPTCIDNHALGKQSSSSTGR